MQCNFIISWGIYIFPSLVSPCNIDPSNDLDHENHMTNDAPTLETYLHVLRCDEVYIIDNQA
jgi:hypothetical protein